MEAVHALLEPNYRGKFLTTTKLAALAAISLCPNWLNNLPKH
jgi:hypothetical protein